VRTGEAIGAIHYFGLGGIRQSFACEFAVTPGRSRERLLRPRDSWRAIFVATHLWRGGWRTVEEGQPQRIGDMIVVICSKRKDSRRQTRRFVVTMTAIAEPTSDR
jgi:hypothetical protein